MTSKLEKVKALANDPRGDANVRAIAAGKVAMLQEKSDAARNAALDKILEAMEVYKRNVFGDDES